MNENINEKLLIENLMLSNDNIKLRNVFNELLDVYIKLLETKKPDNLILPGRNDWESKIK